MMFIYIFIILSVDFVRVILATGKPDPPKNVRVYVIGNTTKISWNISSDQGVTWSRIYLYKSKEGYMHSDLGKRPKHKDIQFPTTSFEIANLEICSEYNVRIRFLHKSQFSEFTKQTFRITTTPSLTFRPDHPFVGNDIIFTCHSVVHRCPGYIPSDLSYKFVGNERGDTDNNTLTLHTLTKSDKGINVSCQAAGDLGKVFYMSDTVTLDPYYGPDKVVLNPDVTSINVTENSTLGPIHCTAACNPICTYQWKHNGTGRFELVQNSLLSNQNQSLTVPHINRSQKGTFRCHVDYYHHQTYEISDVSINVQYGPDRIILEPASTDINVIEGTTLGPIHCTATCNPECKYQWEYNVTGHFEFVPVELVSNQGRTLTVPQIKRSQTGTYRCHAVYHLSEINKTEDVAINVQLCECPTQGFQAVTTVMFVVGIATLVVGLGAVISATTLFILKRVKTKNVRPNESDGYNEVQRSNPVFTKPYSTLQSQPESRPIQDPSSDIYEECGIAPGENTYENIKDGS